MQVISCHNGQLHVTAAAADSAVRWAGATTARTFATGLSALDDLLPHGAFARGAVHELLVLPHHPPPLFVAAMLSRAAADCSHPLDVSDQPWNLSQPTIELRGAIVWSDPLGTLYPPAIAAMGVPMEKLLLLRPGNVADENWAITECLRCRGVAATFAAPRRLSRVEARRFQLAAERGGGVGLLLRPCGRAAQIYAASTRWLVAPCRGERTVQKWKLQLIHGHGGRVGQTVILERHRDPGSVRCGKIHPVRETGQLADRPIPTPARATA